MQRLFLIKTKQNHYIYGMIEIYIIKIEVTEYFLALFENMDNNINENCFEIWIIV